jgi:hypothetical protein
LPENAGLKSEILRRGHFFYSKEKILGKIKFKMPKPAQWNTPSLLDWLREHTLHSDEDRKYLKEKIYGCTVGLLTEQEETYCMNSSPYWQRTGREGMHFPLRLIHAVTADSLKAAFVSRDATLNRMQLDGRKSDATLPTFWNQVKTMFNDKNVVFQSVAIRSWSEHYYAKEHDLSVAKWRRYEEEDDGVGRS